MSTQTDGRITDIKERYKGGVLKYKQMGYWRPDYEPKDTDFICVFRITPQEGVDPEEAAAAVSRPLVTTGESENDKTGEDTTGRGWGRRRRGLLQPLTVREPRAGEGGP